MGVGRRGRPDVGGCGGLQRRMGKGAGQGQAQSVGQLGEAWSGLKQGNCLESTALTSAEAWGPG